MASLLASYSSLRAYNRQDYSACLLGIDSELDACAAEHRQALLFYKATALYHMSRHPEAIRSYRQLLAEPELNTAYRQNALLNYGLIAVLMDDFQLSEACLDQYRLEEEHLQSFANCWQGLLQILSGESQGWQLFENELQGEPNPDYQQNLQLFGLACLKSGELQRALLAGEIERIGECNSEYLLIAMFYSAVTDNQDLAQQCITRLKDFSPSAEVALMSESFELQLRWQQGEQNEEILQIARNLQHRIGDDCPDHMVSIPQLCNDIIRHLGSPPTILVSQKYGIVGDSMQIFELRKSIDKYAPTDLNALILGESGTGKELVARALHSVSNRRDKNFVAVNCYHLGSNLAEAKLFGYKKGAFSGASADTIGFVQKAHGGTLFLDEIGELPPETQANLFRFLDNGIFYPLGSAQEESASIRVIAATNQDLRKSSSFRQELYHRLSGVILRLPRLIERDQDLRTLSQFRVAELNRGQSAFKSISESSLRALEAHDFPGNVRELFNLVTRAWYRAGHEIQPIHLDLEDSVIEIQHGDSKSWAPPLDHEMLDFESLTQEFASRLVKKIYKQLGGHVKDTAKRLNMSERSVYRWIQKSDKDNNNSAT